MNNLPHRHLVTMTLTVDFAGMISIGQTPAGLRRIAPSPAAILLASG